MTSSYSAEPLGATTLPLVKVGGAQYSAITWLLVTVGSHQGHYLTSSDSGESPEAISWPLATVQIHQGYYLTSNEVASPQGLLHDL